MTKKDAIEKFTNAMRLLRKSPRTIEVYTDWLGKYTDFIKIIPSDLPREEKINRFLTMLVNNKRVSATTQKQALCAIVRFFKWVIKEPVGDLDFAKSNRAKRLPSVFSRREAWSILDRLNGPTWLWGAFMYGCGLRLEEVCNLRIKDIDLDRRQVMVREGKGNKDRMLPMPEMITKALEKHLRLLQDLHQEYKEKHIPVTLPDALDKKYPNAPYSWEWFWLFPASGPCQDPRWPRALYHIHHSAVQKRIGAAIRAAKITKKASCHTFRHSFATHWLEGAEGSHEAALLRLQRLMGHRDPKTTMIYLHLLKPKTDVPSPLDARPAIAA